MLFAVELDRRLRDRGVRTFALHPGSIGTDLGRHLMPDTMGDVVAFTKENREPFKTVEQGAATQVWAATAPELDDKGGIYLQDCSIAPRFTRGVDLGYADYADYAVDPANAARLWNVSEALLGEAFDT